LVCLFVCLTPPCQMDGPILAEFSALNSLSHRPQVVGSRTERIDREKVGRGGPKSLSPRRGNGARTEHRDQWLRGETTYTAAMCGTIGTKDSFIDDQPKLVSRCGLAELLPPNATSEEREKLLRRLEMCAKAREESTKITSVKCAQREAKKIAMRRERQVYTEKLLAAQRDREDRWSRRLQKSPFSVDLLADNQRIDEESRVRDLVEQQRLRSEARRSREAHDSIFLQASTQADELDELRAEKRLLLENERQLRALRDVERSNARTAQILQERRRQQHLKQQAHLQQAINGSSAEWGVDEAEAY